MTPQARQALTYVENTAGNATVGRFFEDHAPIGQALWRELRGLHDMAAPRLVTIDTAGKVVLTDAGRAALASPPPI